MKLRFAAAVFAGFLAACGSAHAATLQVSPVLIDVPAPGAAASVTVANLSNDAVVAQVRVFKWIQKNGSDQLVETKDVVVSPPIAKLKPNTKSVLRVVRRAKSAPNGEESYRIVIDQVPEKKRTRGAGISFAVRYSIPVFFGGINASEAPIIWEVGNKSGQTTITATNAGSRRVRIADLKVKSGAGTVSFGKGLTGYVLPGATVSWTADRALKGLKQGGKVAISALTEHGPLQATGIIQGAQ
ncbi:MAG: molecular chaperone [Hyphomicrobiaceae bacterium]